MAPTYAPSHALYAISCHIMYTHTLMVLHQMSQGFQHRSTTRIRVPSGPFGPVEQRLLFEHFFLFPNFRQGGNAWNLFDFDYQSAAFSCVDTLKCYPITSVPSRLEGVKTRPQCFFCHERTQAVRGSNPTEVVSPIFLKYISTQQPGPKHNPIKNRWTY